MADVVVIGANGFMGSLLVDGLHADGHRVTAFDRFSTPPVFDAEVRVLRGDFLNRSDVDAAVSGQEAVFHFLSTTTPVSAEGDPTLDLRTNVLATVELLEACVHAGVGHVYFASTGGAIYGPQGLDSYREEDATLPVSPYAIGKLSIEHYLRYFRVKHGLASTSLRISNPYGGRQPVDRAQGLIPIALGHILRGEPVVRIGDGSMVRDYLYADDFTEMVRRIVRAGPTRPVYNLGSGAGVTVAEVLDALRRVTGEPFEIIEQPVPPTFVDRVVLDTSRFVAEFGAVPLTDIDEGVRRTWEQIRRGGESR